ncbi:iron complex transport system substrate-binding protein [Roseovarius nanhaiticus]|uniref:Iron complex transport system substrate-binding protein n=1 Tax=Roseovarius nanhaiticus TaxID=573024 RepID=A0A1N7GDZ0_9RHOB|nr:ABC transporter substrate-binding protein [Roseovarius nanhaiticus]SEK29166.1 iron complex transport system substrate-binding protein [Roseovarius nanhaiticus]SIS10784.1 iron complex transport system substrate-binding protein [Roseovarius nanhaiticus]
MPHAVAAQTPQRVVSINLCTDQLAMLLAAEDQLVSVSRIALDPRVSPMAEEAQAYIINAGRAEEVHALTPDLVVAGVYTSRDTIAMLRRLGIEVQQFDIVHSLDDVRERILEMGKALGQEARAEAMVARFDADLAQLKETRQGGDAPRAALYYANGYTSGAKSLATDILNAAGLRNAPAEAGYDWGKLPLEMLAMLDPDIVITARRYPGGSRAEEVMDHPVARGLRGQGAGMSDQDWVCGTPFVLRAVRDMAEARRAYDAGRPDAAE